MNNKQKYEYASVLKPYLDEKYKNLQQKFLDMSLNCSDDELIRLRDKYVIMRDITNEIEQDIITFQLEEQNSKEVVNE